MVWHQHKHHLAGSHCNVEPCLQVPDEVKLKFRQLLEISAQESDRKRRKFNDIGEEEEQAYYEYQEGISNQRVRGSMDAFMSRKKPGLQTTLNQKWKKGWKRRSLPTNCSFFYTSVIPFNAVNNPEFSSMCEMIAKFGIGFKPPSYHEIKVKFLNKEVNNVLAMLDEFKEEWKKNRLYNYVRWMEW